MLCNARQAKDVLISARCSQNNLYINYSVNTVQRLTHPWLDERCKALVREKNEAYGTADFQAKQSACSVGLLAAHSEYVCKMREKICNLPSSSKRWWSLSKSLLHQASRSSTVPPLQGSDLKWAVTPDDKANLLADTFAKKSSLKPLVVNEHSGILQPSGDCMSGFLPIRSRSVVRLLKSLSVDKGSGPDQIHAHILKNCADALAVPITILARLILRTGCWPECWRPHWVFPLHKKKSQSDPNNYRGIHLTSHISKIVERIVGKLLQPFLEKTFAYGPNQYAYTSGCGSKDALAYNVLEWLCLLNQGRRIGLYCSDVAGAFDRINTERLVHKLQRKGVHEDLIRVLTSWLAQRTFVVIVDGIAAEPRALRNSVYQGTVLGPLLWNCHYEDARHAVNSTACRETAFADDLNCFKAFGVEANDEEIVQHLRNRKVSLHRWGDANQILFEASKKTFHILHHRHPHGDSFKLLGI